jgi:2-dehydro-3-deoxyphosphooctonate aldolase (KDO 8-P synthase)
MDGATPTPGVEALFERGGPFFVIAGPCVLEDDTVNLRIGEALARISDDLALPIIYKASFDKANRSRVDSPRGPGLQDGLARLERVRSRTGLPVLTDIHEPRQAAAAAEVCDAIQIPAFLCRQTDLLAAAGATGRPVNIKKGQWMAPEEMAGAVEKVRLARGEARAGVSVTERGTFHGYGDLVVDMRSFVRMRDATGAPAVFDGTHSVQRPGQGAGVSGGDPGFIPLLVRAAVAAGADGLFLEVHPAPREAPSDATNMLGLEAFRPLMQEVLAIRGALTSGAAGQGVVRG